MSSQSRRTQEALGLNLEPSTRRQTTAHRLLSTTARPMYLLGVADSNTSRNGMEPVGSMLEAPFPFQMKPHKLQSRSIPPRARFTLPMEQAPILSGNLTGPVGFKSEAMFPFPAELWEIEPCRFVMACLTFAMKRILEEVEIIRYLFRCLTGLVGSLWGAGPFLPM